MNSIKGNANTNERKGEQHEIFLGYCKPAMPAQRTAQQLYGQTVREKGYEHTRTSEDDIECQEGNY